MQDILPEAVLADLRDHYYAGVVAAEIGYEHNAADEDSVTGALGQALLTPYPRFVQADNHTYAWRASHYKLGGRGKGAAERRFGADGVFQLEVLDEVGTVIRRKALLFQAKKEWKGRDQRLLRQVERMAGYSPSAIVIDYRRSGFKGVAGKEVIEAHGNRRAIRVGGDLRLAEILGDEFVRCRRGDIGVFWNAKTQTLERESGVLFAHRFVPGHIMTTTVRRLQ
jgi:hypothetical protein